MDQWLDSLSEDWVSQPGSPLSSSIMQGSVLRDSPSPISNESQSRIPRYKPRSTSGVSTTSVKEPGRSSKMRKTTLVENALREKTSSNLNASPKRQSQGPVKPQVPNAASMRLRGRQTSTGSLPTVPQDTVQHKHSPAKERDTYGTPEWKRRVLKENAGGDLFNPKQLGLEGVFKPPTVKSTPHPKAKGKKTGFAANGIPSSPPPYPSLPRQTLNAPTSDPKKPAAAIMPRDESLEEAQMPHGNKDTTNEQSGSTPSQNDRDVYQSESQKTSTPSGSLQSNHSESPMLCAPPSSHHPTSTDNEPRLARDDLGNSGVLVDKTRNEELSPFYVSRHNTVDGRVEYAAIDMSMRRLRSQMDKMRLQQQNLPSSRSSDPGIDYTESRPAGDSMLQNRIDEVTSQSLPDDLSMGTEAYIANGGFVNLRRGGYSNDGSFQKRPVSPSLLHDLDGPSLGLSSSTNAQRDPTRELPRNFSQTKSRTPSSPTPSSIPHTPMHRKNESTDSNDRPRSSGSPLKLFDKYDTFTNERLVRRMSKFEQTLHNDLLENNEASSRNDLSSSPSPRRRRPNGQNYTKIDAEAPKTRRISSFGYGQLNDHKFPPNEELESEPSFEKAQYDSNSDHSLQHQTKGFQFQRKLSHRTETEVTSRLKPSRRSIQKGSQRDRGDDSANERMREEGIDEDRREAVQTVTGKRLPYSPAKDPAPKRRRTLRNSGGLDQIRLHLQEHTAALQIPASSGRKRKDALYGSDRQAADPSIVAMRQIRQPKVPTPSHTSISRADGFESRVIGGTDQALGKGPIQLEVDENPAIDPPTQIVAGALATVALNTAREVTYGSRKASVTTADFFNEAQQIMQLIRAKGRPRSSHTTTEGSEAGHPTIVEESVVYDSTKDEFSRPPSREGSPRGLKPLTQPDARVISHLRKFEDDQDLGLALSSSLKTLKISQSRRDSRASAPAREKDIDIDANSGAESDPPNIHIRESIVQAHKRKHSSSTHDFSVLEPERQVRSQDSQSTLGPSSGRSNPTGSSHSSTNRMVIAPETVAHLLSDQMAGMVFDRQRQLWVKRKSSPNVGGHENLEHTQSEGTEEDFFGDIPDLTVNEMEELQRVKEAVSSVKSMGSATNKVSVRDQALSTETQREAPELGEQFENARPETAEGRSIAAVDNSSAPSKLSRFPSSGPQPGTRATSWADDAFQCSEPRLPIHPATAAGKSVGDTQEENVEHEISISEGREWRTPKHQSNRKLQARVVTVAFSSPLEDHNEAEPERVQGSDSDEGDLSLDGSPVRYRTPRETSAKRPSSSESAGKLGRRSASRRMSLSNQSYLARPMSRLDEEDEMSMIHCSIGNRHMSMELAITTPLPLSRSILVPATTGQRSSIGFHLSPLPDFTVHQVDQPVDCNHGQVAKKLSKRETDNRLSLCAQDLVKNLTDLEPYEPYWDYIRSVDLHDRGLASLHMLNEFCGRVEELDVSENKIEGLNGIPHTVRQLNIRDNCLSDLAAWDTLQNLQYLDVSGNQLASLRGFQQLVHLRSLKADNNGIESLIGLEDLNGLISLSLRGNRLRAVDFENFDLQRLTKLDLHDNELVQVCNLHQLPVLETCTLSKNDLETLDFAISVRMSRLETLDVSDNRLSFIDLAEIPYLKTLNLDRNSLASIESLRNLRHLAALSWREQTLVPAYGFSEVQYQHCQEVRNLYLSSNTISTFTPASPFLNLQSLELASTGLQSLSSDFGLKCPNLRDLNLNYNAIRDLRPLLGVVKLQRLSLAGNRLFRLRRTAAVLDRLGQELVQIDLRNNPLTVGFYTPQESSRTGKQLVTRLASQSSLDNGEDSEMGNAKAYLLAPLDQEADNLSRERLDEDTKLRRRVYEMLVVNACKTLKELDGLEVDRKMVGRKDDVWDRLVELGVLKEKRRDNGE